MWVRIFLVYYTGIKRYPKGVTIEYIHARHLITPVKFLIVGMKTYFIKTQRIRK